ncbi:MAG: Fe-S cluster assembly protein SufD, partial [Actinomycetota bacterium]|nr:Fe-S cluster assembly protein SufD [Actinomycetota bacterium]
MSRFTTDAAVALDGPAWLRARRAAAAERFAATNLPTEAEEIWRYSRVSRIDLDAYSPVNGPGTSGSGTNGSGNGVGPTSLPGALEQVLALAGPRAALLVVHNGRIVHRELDPALAARGVVVGDALELPDAEGILDATDTGVDAFTELNTAFMRGTAVVSVPPG